MQNKAFVHDPADPVADDRMRYPRKPSLKPTVFSIPEEVKNETSLNLTPEQIERLNNIHSKTKRSVSIVTDQKEAKKRDKKQKALEKKEKKKADDSKEWVLYTKPEKTSYIVFSILKVILFIVLLYLFLLSLNFMTIGFTMVSSYAIKAGPVIRFVLANPFAALAIGIIVTAIMQNATATTSIAVSMVGAGIIPDVQAAIPIIMGANIGTCVTNSLIALTLSGDPNEFKRAFSGATLNDMFNFLTTSVLLPVEIFSHMLFIISDEITKVMPFDNIDAIASANFMAFILNPVCNLFILLDADAVNAVSNGEDVTEVALRCCESVVIQVWNNQTSNVTTLMSNMTTSMTTLQAANGSYLNQTVCIRECTYWCMPMLRALGDGGTGLFWIVISIIVLISCLFGIVKVLSLLIVGPVAKGVNIAINASFPGKMKWFTQVILFIIALLLTIIVQSSNIITATLVPLCGIGIVSLQRVFVMTLGSNIGTTVTGILTAFTGPPASLRKSMQLAFVYTLFNSMGVLFWLPIPYLRFPKLLARALGNIVFKYRWFLFVYVISVYFVLPLVVFGLALIPYWIGLAIFGLPIVFLIISIVIIKVLRSKAPRILPPFLKDFGWLPIYLRSLEPWDTKMKNLSCCCGKKKKKAAISGDNKSLSNYDDEIHAEEPSGFSNIIRRMSTINPLVNEARRQSRRNTLTNNSSSEDEHDIEEVKEYRRRKSVVEAQRRASVLEAQIYPKDELMTRF